MNYKTRQEQVISPPFIDIKSSKISPSDGQEYAFLGTVQGEKGISIDMYIAHKK